MKYLKLTITTTHEAADIVGLILIEEGSQGVSIVDPNDIRFVMERDGWDYIEKDLEEKAKKSNKKTAQVSVSGVFHKDYDIKVLNNLLVELRERSEIDVGLLEIKTEDIDSKDYENEWKKYYQIMEIGRIAIVPKWRDYEGELISIKLNPGKAFGTGDHETTQMCLELMQELKLKDKVIVDVGCGSGILGIAAAKLGAGVIHLIDIDPLAIEASKENMSLNDLSSEDHKILKITSEVITGLGTFENLVQKTPVKNTVDIIFANLTADILIAHAASFASVLKKNSKLIVSGIINSREIEVMKAFNNFKPLKKMKKGEWQAVLFERI
ncbi:MAG: 50S ribosomal protein L11 methyltransferase [Firmicutes bacterium]|nr:50S ribosomal protein L11 methyltransferase [Bacillota bacterium]